MSSVVAVKLVPHFTAPQSSRRRAPLARARGALVARGKAVVAFGLHLVMGGQAGVPRIVGFNNINGF